LNSSFCSLARKKNRKHKTFFGWQLIKALQQQDDNATTIDEPNIPIGPADEGPDEPIPNNENGTDDDDNETDDYFGSSNGECIIEDPADYEEGTYFQPFCEAPADDQSNDDKPDTCINWVRSLDTGKDVRNGGHTNSHYFKIDFQSTATDTGSGSHVGISFDGDPYYTVASPHYFTIVSDGCHTISLKGVDKYGNEDPTPAKFTFTVKKDKGGGYPDTWINWVRATPRGVNIANGGSTSSSTVIVDFQGTVAGKGSHIDLKIDSGSHLPVASRHTITGLSDGPHTIYLKAVNQAGKTDPTPAKWRFTVIDDD
jgi:hypothetical protein